VYGYTELIEEGSADISKVIHKANITVNETGTEAAAVTVIEMRYTSTGVSPETRTVTFTADHPFLYTISETTSQAILFTGVYTGE
jgi:serpin B